MFGAGHGQPPFVAPFEQSDRRAEGDEKNPRAAEQLATSLVRCSAARIALNHAADETQMRNVREEGPHCAGLLSDIDRLAGY
jgi:hypothetical protein